MSTSADSATALAVEAAKLLRLENSFPKHLSLYTNLAAQRSGDDENLYHLLYATFNSDGDATPNFESISVAMHGELAENCDRGKVELEEFDDRGYWTNYKRKRIVAHLKYLVERGS